MPVASKWLWELIDPPIWRLLIQNLFNYTLWYANIAVENDALEACHISFISFILPSLKLAGRQFAPEKMVSIPKGNSFSNPSLGGGFIFFKIFTPIPGEMIQIWRTHFS